VAAAAAVVFVAVGVARDDPRPPDRGGIAPGPGDNTSSTIGAPAPAATTPPVTSVTAPPGAASIEPADLAQLTAAAVADAGPGGPALGFEIWESQMRTRADGTTYAWAYLHGAYGRLFVEAYPRALDVVADPPVPGQVVQVDEQFPASSRLFVWPVDPAFNTVATVSDRQTIVLRTETFEGDAETGVFGDPAIMGAGITVRLMGDLAARILADVADATGTPLPAPPPQPIPANTVLVDLLDLDQPGERVPVEAYQEAIAEGPITGTDGRTYGNMDTTAAANALDRGVDFIGMLAPDDPREVIIGFLAASSMLPGASSDLQLLYGVNGDVVGMLRQREVTDANGAVLWTNTVFEQLPPDGTLPVAAAPELGVHDRDGNGVLSREELHSTADALRRVIGNGVQGNVYASDLEPFLESMAGVDDPTTGAVSVIVPMFDLSLQPIGNVDLGAADTIIFDEAGQPIGGWNTD
jgi:hypothetical protein